MISVPFHVLQQILAVFILVFILHISLALLLHDLVVGVLCVTVDP